MKYFLLLFLSLSICSETLALEFSRLGGTFVMRGEIEKDDSLKFILEFASWDNPPTIFHIDSNGGNLDEAMRIGEIIRESQIPVWSGESCNSACAFIFAAGVERWARGPIGLHRPYFEQTYFANLSSIEAQKKYEELRGKSESYLDNMGVSDEIIDRMFSTGSTEVDFLSEEEANDIFGFRLPFYEEWLTAKCGKFTEEQSKVLGSLGALRTIRAMIAVLEDPELPTSDSFGSNAPELASEAQLALQMEEAGMLEPYIEMSEIHQNCEERAANSHVRNFHYTVQQSLLELQ